MSLRGKKIAILVERDYQDLEVWFPALRLREEGAQVEFIGTDALNYKGKFGYPVTAHKKISQAKASAYQAVIIPGGWAPDFFRRYPAVIKFVRQMNKQKKVIASICHGGWLLASADVVRGKKLTSFSAIKDDVVNAGGRFLDKEVVVDGNLITSRKPDDLPAFCRAIIGALQ